MNGAACFRAKLSSARRRETKITRTGIRRLENPAGRSSEPSRATSIDFHAFVDVDASSLRVWLSVGQWDLDQRNCQQYVVTGCHLLTEIVYPFQESHTCTITFLPRAHPAPWQSCGGISTDWWGCHEVVSDLMGRSCRIRAMNQQMAVKRN